MKYDIRDATEVVKKSGWRDGLVVTIKTTSLVMDE
jgi:hypothetical protein